MSTTSTTRAKTGRGGVSPARGVGLVGVLVGVVMALVVCGSASAAISHEFIEGIGGGETPAGFMLPFGVAVDNSSSASAGDVYASGFLSSAVNKFKLSAGKYVYACQVTGAGEASASPSECDTSEPGVPSGAFSFPFAGRVAVDGSGDVFVSDGDPGVNSVYEFDAAGRYLSQIALEGTPQAMAVNRAGEVLIAAGTVVYLYDPGTSKLSVFASGTPAGGFGEATGVAVDDDPSSPSVDRVYVVDAAMKVVDVFDSTGKYLSSLTGTPSGAFPAVRGDVVDPSTGDLYVTAGRVIDEFGPDGTFLGRLEGPGVEEVFSVAVNGVTGEVFGAVFGEGVVDRFGAGVVVPDVSVGGVSGVGTSGVTVSGKVDPAGGGEVTSCEFEYGTSPGVFGESASCSPAAPFGAPTEVSAAIGGLTADTLYYYRLAVGNTNGTNAAEGTFETAGQPSVAEESAGPVRQTSAVVEAKINPHGFATTYEVEYGETEAYGSTVPVSPASAGSGLSPQPESVEIPGLELNKEYHYRFVASNEQGVVPGPDATFTTRSVALVENQMWLAGPHEATLKAKIEDYGAPTECEVEYVTEAAFSSEGYASPTIAVCGPQHVAGKEGALFAIARPKGLAANTTYHFRFLLSNEYGEIRSVDQTFATFGFAAFTMNDLEQEGQPYTQAGGHPYELSTSIELNTTSAQDGTLGPSGTIRNVKVHLPAGLIGNPQAVQKCTRYDSEHRRCSGATQVGLITVRLLPRHPGEPPLQEQVPLYNLVPPRGVAAELGARFNNFANAFIDGGVRTGSDYGLDADSLRITTLAGIVGVDVTVWGVPAASVHDVQRGCGNGFGYATPCSANEAARAFLRNPTSCTSSPVMASMEGDSYQAPGEFVGLSTQLLPAVTGCELLPFTPSVSVQPESGAAESPTGLHVGLHIPQEEDPGRLTEADLKEVITTLPQGMSINPSAAGGRTACSPEGIELSGPEAAHCPDASKIGSVEVDSPLVDHALKGSVYLAQQGNAGPGQGSNPFGSLLAVYIAIDDPETGVVVKQAGEVTANAVTGQLTARFKQIPQLPFEDLKLDFYGGPRAPLATPAACGASYTTESSLTPWSGEPSVGGTSVFAVTSGPGGSGCPSDGFAPSFVAGTEDNQAGGFSPLSTVVSREDGTQHLAAVTVHTPPGLLGKLASVTPCPEPQASLGMCGQESEIGNTVVTAGVGADPFTIAGGRVFITGPYKGAPYGLSIAEPAKAGPFDLGEGSCDCIVVRAKIDVDPHTAALTVTSDRLPTILQGIPLDIRRVAVSIDRKGFIFNPTSCDELEIKGTIAGEHGASSTMPVSFEAANCAKLAFKPRFTASTQAKSSKAGGASLRVKITSGAGQANLGKAKVYLPVQLPSRLATLQKACLAGVFEANPASCPAGSLVGSARAVSPVVKTPFTGPAYLVSHGGAAFPDLEIVLQSEGITIIQDGKTDIKKGITSSTFNAIPDAPINTFELNLPQGPHSALATFLPAKAKRSFCGQKLLMPTLLTGQNGAVIKQATKIAVTGCPKKHTAKTGSKAKKTKH